MSSKTNVTDLTGFSGLQHRFLSSAFAKDAVGVLGTDHFVMLQEIEALRRDRHTGACVEGFRFERIIRHA